MLGILSNNVNVGYYNAAIRYDRIYLTDENLVSYRNNGILIANPSMHTYLGNTPLEALKAIAYFYDYYKEFDLMDVVGYIIDHNQQTVNHMEPIAGRVYTSGHKYQDIPVEDRDNIKIYAFIAQETAPNGRRYQNVFGYELFAEITKKKCYAIDCSNDWQIIQNKINNETGDCIHSCYGKYEYNEYNEKCYDNCRNGA